MKQVIFNVGGALSTYIEFSGKKVLIDIGSRNSSFSPINSFLLPLYEKRKVTKVNGKYEIDQLVISHPHDDHISEIESFDKFFYAELLTVPNSNDGQAKEEKVNWDLIKNPKESYVEYLKKKMLVGRNPPLKSCINHINLYWIKPETCENILEKSNYANNLSICTIIEYNGIRTLLPGDMMKDGMEYLISTNSGFKNKIKEGIDVLVTPHHGLKSAFSEELFKTMKDNKTRCLNIVPEKATPKDDVRQVDTRYSKSDYCSGKNNLSAQNEIVCQRKTSNGHIGIIYEYCNPKFEILKSDEELLEFFLS